MIQIEKLIPGGFGLATLPDGKKGFFWNALPGEIVTEYEITKNKSHFIEAIATNIEHFSPHRIEPLDSCYLSTSPWQIMDFDYEMREKQALTVEIFREHEIKVDMPKVFTDGHRFGYRNKMEYSLYWDHALNAIRLSFHVRGSHHKIPIEKSSIERPEIFAHAKQIIDELNSRHEEARRYQSLLLRCNQDGMVSGGLYENHRPHPKFKHLRDTILNQAYQYSPNGFFQINLPVYEMALAAIKPHILTDKVLDFYAGVGTIGLSVAKDHDLTLVEIDKSAYQELKNNCTNSPNATPVLEKSENATNYITKDATVIVDPPRAGCDSKLINRLLEVLPSKIIYLSCNPATQARDLKNLLEKYHLDSLQIFNFFPATPHIESLAVLSR